MESSTTERLTGRVTGVHGTHVFLEFRARRFYARRSELDFNDPCLGLQVSFLPRAQRTPVSLPYALEVRKL